MGGFVELVSHPLLQKCSWLSKSHPSSLRSLTHSFILSLIHSLIQVAFPKDLLLQWVDLTLAPKDFTSAKGS